MHQRAAQFVTVTATLFMATIAGPLMLSAAGLNGNLSLSSSGVDTIAVNGSDIDFDFAGTESMGFPPVVTSGTVDGTGDTGLFDITSASTGSFGAGSPVAGTTVTVHDLNSISEPVGTTVGPSLPLTTFITFSAEPGWNITLTEINPGDGGSACNGTSVTCTPVGSPFNLQNEDSATQTSGNVLVGFSFIGTEQEGVGGPISNVSGTFSTTFSGTSYQAILADLNLGESIVSSASATIAITPMTATPEPASIYLFLLGSGLLVGSAAYRRHQRR